MVQILVKKKCYFLAQIHHYTWACYIKTHLAATNQSKWLLSTKSANERIKYEEHLQVNMKLEGKSFVFYVLLLQLQTL